MLLYFTPRCLTLISPGIKAEVLVVQSFEELKQRASEATGRIVVFNQPFVSYGETVAYRAYGASEAAKVGAVATLIRSITPFSINRYILYKEKNDTSLSVCRTIPNSIK